MGLDEYEEAALRNELAKREDMRRRGYCDYCYRPHATPPCKFPERHKCPTCGGTGRVPDGYGQGGGSDWACVCTALVNLPPASEEK